MFITLLLATSCSSEESDLLEHSSSKEMETYEDDALRPSVLEDADCHLAPDEFTCLVEMEVLRLTNVKRSANGRREFTNAKFIGCASRLWSAEMARRGSISHDWFSNGTLRQKYRDDCSGTGTISAENVAMSSGSGQTPESVATQFVNMWWNSPGHRTNMLGNYRSMGVGFHKRGNSWYGTQNFGAE